MKLAFRLALTLASITAIFASDSQCGEAIPADAKAAGPDSEKQCLAMAADFKTTTGFQINNTFSQYFAEGSMPSLELLMSLYPNGTLPPRTNVANILSGVGPDIDLKSDAGYARTSGRAGQNGPLGGMPAFCRFGAFIKTSEVTNVLMEVWLPLDSDAKVPMAAVNASDFPTNTTGVLVNADGTFTRAPLYYTQKLYDTVEPSPYAHKPPAPNDVPVVKEKKSKGSKAASTKDKTLAEPDSTTKKQELGTAEQVIDGSATGLKAAKPLKMTTRAIKKPIVEDKKKGADSKLFTGEELLGTGTGWNGRLMALGNGGQRGNVPFTELKQVMSRYGFAVTGNNGGHFSGTSAVTFINGTQFEDTLLDFGSRANHVSLKLAEDVVDFFYGKTEGVRVESDGNRVRSYYAASSVGAGRGFASMQVNPKDFHGYLLGPPAIGFMDLNIGQLATQRVHNKTLAGEGWFTQGALYGPIKETVVEQCDELDGVKDGIISDPFKCKFKLEPALLCGGKGKFSNNNGTCLTQIQIDNVYSLYKDTMLDGKFVYPAYLPGLEDSASTLRGRNAKASGWAQLVVYKNPTLDPKFDPFKDISYDALQKGKMADPGKFNADNPDLKGFLEAGAKTICYHGTSDLVISPQATIRYLDEAVKKTGEALRQSVKLYMIPGMKHSRGGRGPINFGGITHTDAGARPLKYDSKHDMILSLVAWVEKNSEPKEQIAATYNMRSAYLPSQPIRGAADGPDTDMPITDVYQNYNWGVHNTRKLCPWPLKAVYKSGITTGERSHESFECA